MHIMLVDDEQSALNALQRALHDVAPSAHCAVFLYADEALAHAQKTAVDVAFLDIEMSEMTGLCLAKGLKDTNGLTNIVFVTGHGEYALSAFQVAASDYLMKPVDAKQVATALENLRHPVRLPDRGVRIQCFGSFEVFVDGKPVVFHRAKAKEALAYLVDRKGASISKKALAAVLWEDQPYSRSLQSHLHKLMEEIERALNAAHAQSFLIKAHGFYAVDTSRFACDYYEFQKGEPMAVNAYRGEYLSDYSWGEFTAGFLDRVWSKT